MAGARHAILVGLHRYVESWVNVPHLFARAGASVDVVVPKWHPLKLSKWVRRSYLTDGSDPDFARVVCERIRSGEYQFFHQCDEPGRDALYSCSGASQISEFLQVAPGSELANTFGRKDLFFEWCAAHQIPAPKTARVSGWAQTESAIQSMGFPCMIKRVSGSGGKNSVFFLHSLEEARRTAEWVKDDNTWLVQEFVPGTTASAAFFSARGELRAWFATTKLGCLSGGLGPQVLSGYTVHPRIESICAQFAKAGAIHGITGFDFMIRPSGECLVIDPHFGRSIAILHFAPLCNVDFGRALSDWLDGRPSFMRPDPCDMLAVKYPEVIRFACEGNWRRLLREASPFSRKVRYFYGPKGDWRMMSAITLSKLAELARITAGSVRQRLRGSKSSATPE